MTSNFRTWTRILTLLTLLLLAACAARPGKSPEDIVRAKSEAYWQALIAEDYARAYGFLAPGYREKARMEVFAIRFLDKTRWKNATVSRVECEEERCLVHVLGQFRFLGDDRFPAYEGETELKERWVRVDNDWWLVPRR